MLGPVSIALITLALIREGGVAPPHLHGVPNIKVAQVVLVMLLHIILCMDVWSIKCTLYHSRLLENYF